MICSKYPQECRIAGFPARWMAWAIRRCPENEAAHICRAKKGMGLKAHQSSLEMHAPTKSSGQRVGNNVQAGSDFRKNLVGKQGISLIMMHRFS